MSNTWFTSDTHIGHGLVAHLRGFDSPAEHAHVVAQRWDRCVQDEDEVWVLGDVVMGMDRDEGLQWFAQRRGARKHLVLGNHDRAHPMHTNAQAHIATYAQVFDTVQTVARVSLAGDGAARPNLSHFPYEGDRGEGRFMEWRLRDAGRVLLHGHTHLPERVTRTSLGTLQIHVGLDAWDLRPVQRSVVRTVIEQALAEGPAPE